jgi:RNA polymerase sigma factor (sigma-70 family)
MEIKKQFSNKALEDFDLIRKAVEKNDEKAYSSLMKRYRKPVYHMVYKMVRNNNDAEDLTIEAFAKAFKNLSKFNPEYTFSTWLFRIATNNCIDFIRKKKLNTTSIDTTYTNDDGESVGMEIRDLAMNPQDEAIHQQKIEIMRMIVQKLPTKYQSLVALRYFDELSYEEIAQELQAPLGTVKAQLHRARELLQDLVRPSRDHI